MSLWDMGCEFKSCQKLFLYSNVILRHSNGQMCYIKVQGKRFGCCSSAVPISTPINMQQVVLGHMLLPAWCNPWFNLLEEVEPVCIRHSTLELEPVIRLVDWLPARVHSIFYHLSIADEENRSLHMKWRSAASAVRPPTQTNTQHFLKINLRI